MQKIGLLVPYIRNFKKFMLIMKLCSLLLLVSLATASAKTSYSQQTKFTLNLDHATVKQLFDKIEESSEFIFVYYDNILDLNKEVTVTADNETVEEILEKVFKSSENTYKIFDRQIVIAKKESSEIEAKATTVQQQQKREITGSVKDSNGQPLPGVSVFIKGTTIGTITDNEGNFSLAIPAGGKILAFSFVGMTGQEVTIGNQTVVNIKLLEETIGINEVMVVGYGTQRKNAVTGAVTTAKLDVYKDVPENNIIERLKGTVAGLNVGEANTAGAVPGFTIRGQNSIAASSAPLIVLDGAIFSGSMADIAPFDIESVTILKDASAAAIYGSRSSNGVILIESKKGSGIEGKPKFQFNSSYGVVNELNPLRLYDAKGYLQRLNDILNDNGTVVTADQTPNYLQTIEKKNYDATPDHKPTLADPWGLIRQTGFNQNTSLSVSNRTDKLMYYMSGNFTSQKGVEKNDVFKHYSIRANLESKVTDWLTLGMKTYFSLRDYPDTRVYGAGANYSPFGLSPYADIYNADGSYNQFPQTTTSAPSPFWAYADEAYNKTYNLNGIFNATIKVPWIKGLTYTPTYSQTFNFNENGTFYGYKTHIGQPVKGDGTRNYSRNNTSLLDHLVKYNHTFADKHNVDLTLLYSTEKYSYFSQSSNAKGYDNPQLGTYRLQAGQTATVSSGGGDTKSIGQMARLTYTFNDKYAITGTFRRDGFSAFSANKKYGDFPSVGVNWNISKESFMKKVSFIDALSIRGSYGTNGNQSIAAYSTLSKVANDYYFFQGDNNYTQTEYISTLGNQNLGWESRTGFNAGVDFSVLKGRISGSVDLYATKTNNLAFTLNLPGSSGYSSITANAGEIRNKGIELNLSSVNIKTKMFQWRSEYSFSLNRNKVAHLLGDTNKDGKEDDIISSNLFIGRSLGQLYTYKVIGMYQQADKDNGTILAGFQPGYYKLNDVNLDGKITSDFDRSFIGNSKENFRWSYTNTFTYGNLTLLVYLNSIWGGNNWFLASNTPYRDGYANNGAINHAVYDYWTPTNTGAEFPRPNYIARAAVSGDKYYDRSFIRLQKVALSYDITQFVKKYKIQKLDLSVSADNLGTYSPHWIGLDPATGSGLTDSVIPSLRTILVSLNINF